MTELSTEFEENVGGRGGHLMMTCQCGVTYYDATNEGGWTWEEGELEELDKQAETDDKMVGINHDGVHSIVIMGTPYVFGCPCEYAQKIELVAWELRDQFCRYYRARMKTIRKDLDSVQENLDKAQTAIDELNEARKVTPEMMNEPIDTGVRGDDK